MKLYLLTTIFVIFAFSHGVFAQTSAQQRRLLQTLLDLPAPPPQNPKRAVNKGNKMYPEDFFDPSNPPSDDAPIEDLLNYWERQSSSYDEFRYNVKPSAETLKRIVGEIEDKPELLEKYLKILPPEPEIAEVVKRIYRDRIEEGENFNYQTKRWLKYNSDLFINELWQEAQNVKDANNYIQGDDEVIALAKVDWERARNLVARLESNPGNPASYTLAKFILYHRAVRLGNTSDAESYRAELKKIVEDKTAFPGVRDLAMDALVLGGDFEGRDEWYMSLLSDETLLEMQNQNYTGLTTLPRHSPKSREKWIPSMIKLVNEGTLAERSAAVRNLMQIIGNDNIEVVRLMLPLLADKNWIQESNDDERLELIRAIGHLDIPEAVPGLIAVVMNEDGETRAAAAESLVRFKPPEAISALRFALENETANEYRKTIIEVLIALNGLSAAEQLAGLESYAKLVSSEDGVEKFDSMLYQYEYDEDEDEDEEEEKPPPPMPVNLFIGYVVAGQSPPADALILRLIERLPVIQKNDPPTAKFLSDLMRNWDSRIIDLQMLKQLENGTADVETILLLLTKRADMRGRVPNELSFMQSKNGIAGGIAAVMSENEGATAGVLNAANTEGKISVLAAARLIRAKLPVEQVAALLDSSDKLLALAAERYLESEDGTAARSLLLARHPNEAVLYGARTAFVPNDKNGFENLPLPQLFQTVADTYYRPTNAAGFIKNEDKLRDEIKNDPDLQAVFALVGDESAGNKVIRVYTDKILFTDYEDEARYRERTLSAREYEAFYNFLLEKRIDSLAPEIENCGEVCPAREFLMFGKNGGRRIFFNGYDLSEPFKSLVKVFESLSETQADLKYNLAAKIPGLEVLLADKNLLAATVWKKDGKLALLIADTEKQKTIFEELREAEKQALLADLSKTSQDTEEWRIRRIQSYTKHLSWRSFENGKLSVSEIAQPADVLFLSNRPPVSSYRPDDLDRYQKQIGNFEIRAVSGDLVRIDLNGTTSVIKEGNYINPLVTTDGKWIVAGKFVSYGEPMQFVRINAQTGKEFVVKITPADIIAPVSNVLSQNKVLIKREKSDRGYGSRENNPSPETPEYYLLDAGTGAIQPVKGEFRPLQQQKFRGLQPTANSGEFWAAIPDETANTTEIGLYNDKTFSFKPLLKLPEISFDSLNMLVDETAAKIYFTYEGHLLALPLPGK